jgi:hypothetical protein
MNSSLRVRCIMRKNSHINFSGTAPSSPLAHSTLFRSYFNGNSATLNTLTNHRSAGPRCVFRRRTCVGRGCNASARLEAREPQRMRFAVSFVISETILIRSLSISASNERSKRRLAEMTDRTPTSALVFFFFPLIATL